MQRSAIKGASGNGARAGRLASLDAYRGFVMLALLTNGGGLVEVSQAFPESGTWAFLGEQFSHSAWEGCTFWDLIQPSFMFIVGVAIPFSFAARLGHGQARRKIYAHALTRAAVLIVLGLVGVFIIRELVLGRIPGSLYLRPGHILTQIGLSYGLAFLTVELAPPKQLGIALGILALYWLGFALYPTAPVDPSLAAAAPGYFEGFFAHWNRGANLGTAVDDALRSLLGGAEVFPQPVTGLQSLNFLPGVSSTIFGMLAGQWLRTGRRDTVRGLLLAGALCVVAGLILASTLTPLVKWIWTASFALYSTGWALWLLAAFHWLIDRRGWRGWAFPLIVAGMNPLTLFLIDRTARWYIGRGWEVLLGDAIFDSPYGPVWRAGLSLLALWLIGAFLYWRRIFIRL